MRKLIVGNWKMNGVLASLRETAGIVDAARASVAEVALCPPFTLVGALVSASHGVFAVGAQDCHPGQFGAHTGCVSPAMLADLGATYVIVGHSERRYNQGETDIEVRSKVEAAIAEGLIPIVCIGETEAQRDAGETLRIVGEQLAQSLSSVCAGATLVVAYEPVWAIGSARTPKPEQIGEVHRAIRSKLIEVLGDAGTSVRILYGGSVNRTNAAQLMAIPDVDGALVGGASLMAADFVPILAAAD